MGSDTEKKVREGSSAGGLVFDWLHVRTNLSSVRHNVCVCVLSNYNLVLQKTVQCTVQVPLVSCKL